MNALQIMMIIFVILETLNVLTLYFKPDAKVGNGLGVFNAWQKSTKDQDVHALVKYLTNWVAGTKLIFIGLILTIVIWGNSQVQLAGTIILIASILSFYWRLYPIIKMLDSRNQITPKGYAKSLNFMIAGILLMFLIGLIIHYQ